MMDRGANKRRSLLTSSQHALCPQMAVLENAGEFYSPYTNASLQNAITAAGVILERDSVAYVLGPGSLALKAGTTVIGATPQQNLYVPFIVQRFVISPGSGEDDDVPVEVAIGSTTCVGGGYIVGWGIQYMYEIVVPAAGVHVHQDDDLYTQGVSYGVAPACSSVHVTSGFRRAIGWSRYVNDPVAVEVTAQMVVRAMWDDYNDPPRFEFTNSTVVIIPSSGSGQIDFYAETPACYSGPITVPTGPNGERGLYLEFGVDFDY